MKIPYVQMILRHIDFLPFSFSYVDDNLNISVMYWAELLLKSQSVINACKLKLQLADYSYIFVFFIKPIPNISNRVENLIGAMRATQLAALCSPCNVLDTHYLTVAHLVSHT